MQHIVDVVRRAQGDLEKAGQIGRAARVGQGRCLLDVPQLDSYTISPPIRGPGAWIN
jgi:hypothetical protein